MASQPKLPPGWHSHIDESSGETYYYSDDNITVWNLEEIPGYDPNAASEPAPEEPPASDPETAPRKATTPQTPSESTPSYTSSSATPSSSSQSSSSSSSSAAPTSDTSTTSGSQSGLDFLKKFPSAPLPAAAKDLPQYTENLFMNAFLSIVFFPFLGTIPLVIFLIANITWLLVLFIVGVIGASLSGSRWPHSAYLLIDFFEMGAHLALYFLFFYKPAKIIFANPPKFDTPLLDVIPYSPTKNVQERKFYAFGLIATAIHHIYIVVWCLYGTNLTPGSGGWIPGVMVFVEFARIVHLCRFGFTVVLYIIMGYVRFNWGIIRPIIYGQQVTETATA